VAGVEQVPGSECHHGEGPCWADAWGGLRWVDMLAGDVMSLDRQGAVARSHVGSVAAVIRPRVSGGAVVALADRFAVTDGDLARLTTVARLALGTGVRLNDGGCDPDGRFYCGSMASAETPRAGTFFRLDPDGSVRSLLDQVTISNGFDFAPDGSVAYYIDTPEQGIDVFDYSRAAGLQNRRRWIDIPEEAGRPDGLTVDAEGGVWVALMGGSAVRRYSDAGTLDAVITLPVSQVTACTFGGPGLDTLFVTTSRLGADMSAQPASGSLFAAQPGVGGLPCRPFAG
jgi:sugar lactone lactonase YvrE